MKTLSATQIKEIKADADKNWGGDIEKALAAFTHSTGMVLKFAQNIKLFADMDVIENLKNQILKANQTPAKTTAKKPKTKTPAKKKAVKKTCPPKKAA